jgi:hypothetical protein
MWGREIHTYIRIHVPRLLAKNRRAKNNTVVVAAPDVMGRWARLQPGSPA